jgi:N-acetylmuramoyl-L-alanine amidase
MIRRTSLITVFSFLCMACLFCQVANGAEPASGLPQPIEKRYDEAKFYYNQLQTNEKIASSRENWLKGTRNFRRIYLSSPKSDLAPSCLFMLGRLYSDMFDRFQMSKDLDESISYFKDVIRLFPGNRLADDAYYSLGQIYLHDKDSPQKASDYLIEIIDEYPSGDMYPKAENLLKILSKEHDIALPKAMMSSTSLNNLSYVLPVKYWSSANYTRVVIVASSPVKYNEVMLEKTPKHPTRLYIDFQKSYIEPQYRAPVPIEDGLLKRIRTGQFSPDTVRVVLDIESLSNYKIYSLPDPFRVVIDVMGDNEELASKKSPAPPAIASQSEIDNEDSTRLPVLSDQKKLAVNGKQRYRPAVEIRSAAVEEPSSGLAPSLAQQLGLGVKTIVIDPGHGGKDPGAMAYGMKEKDIVLAIARQLRPVLEKELGARVILTRENDEFVSLEERTAIANTQGADLFVSLHINAHPSSKVRGLETYYLNLTTNAEAMRVAAMENATSTHQMSDLQDILSDIMKNSKIEESSRLALQVHNSILDEAQAKGYADIKNLGVKQAPFYVLIGAQMPAILIEVAFITNKADVKNIKDPLFTRMLTQEIAEGIRSYINDTSAQLNPPQQNR